MNIIEYDDKYLEGKRFACRIRGIYFNNRQG